MELRFPEFRELTLADAKLLREHALRAGKSACEYSFTNLMIWRDFDRVTRAIHGGNLCLCVEPRNESPFFLEPIGGSNPLATARILADRMPCFSRISESFARQLAEEGFDVGEIPDHHDYLYETRDLAEMRGRRYDGKRGHIRKVALRDPGYRVVSLERGHLAEARALFEGWAAFKLEGGGEWDELPELAVSCQRLSIERLFEHFEELGIVGAALIAGGRMAGFIAGSALGEEGACLHLGYADPRIPGSFPALLQGACRTAFAGFAWVNLEQDLGLAGLRKTKRSYHPSRLERKFEARKPLANWRAIR